MMSMRTIKDRINNEIEYLQALAEVYCEKEDAAACRAAVAAVDALKRLAETLDPPAKDPIGHIAIAA
jgi:hypothetical protein